MNVPVLVPDETASLPPRPLVVLLHRANGCTWARQVLRALAHALDKLGLATEILDDLVDVRQVSAALANPNCLFFVVADGAGAELTLTRPLSNALVSAYAFYDKTLFDVLLAPPGHESMPHLFQRTGPWYRPLVLHPSQMPMAHLLGLAQVRLLAPIALPSHPRPRERRHGAILVHLSDIDLEEVRSRLDEADTYRGRVWKALFEGVLSETARDWKVDPWVALLRACMQSGVGIDPTDADFVLLVSAVLDGVQAARENAWIDAVKGAPVTVLAPPSRCAALQSRIPDLACVAYEHAEDALAHIGDARALLHPAGGSGFASLLQTNVLASGTLLMSGEPHLLVGALEAGCHFVSWESPVDAGRLINLATENADFAYGLAERGREAALRACDPLHAAETMLRLAGSPMP